MVLIAKYTLAAALSPNHLPHSLTGLSSDIGSQPK